MFYVYNVSNSVYGKVARYIDKYKYDNLIKIDIQTSYADRNNIRFKIEPKDDKDKESLRAFYNTVKRACKALIEDLDNHIEEE